MNEVSVEIRYISDRCLCRSYKCKQNELPKVGDWIDLTGIAKGKVVNVSTYDDEQYTVYVEEEYD